MAARAGGCQQLNETTERYVFLLTGATPVRSFRNTIVQCTQSNGTWTEEQELAMPVSTTLSVFVN
jgi:hypothetical protein